MQTLIQLQNGKLRGAVSLKISEGLTEFPREIFELSDTLEILDLSFNNLNYLPSDFGRLKKLKVLFCSENLFTVMPEVLADCPFLDIVGFKSNLIEIIPSKSLNLNFRWLILTNNKIASLPAEIGGCIRMQKLMLAGNKLKRLPIELSLCKNLSLLRISANRLSVLPDWLLSMPKLAWLAFSGNSFATGSTNETIPYVYWKDLILTDQLGEGASGTIYKATKAVNKEIENVAVKIFKGSITSDGLPEDELKTCIAAGKHSGIVKLLGQIAGHPEAKRGLVMELIPNRFYNLGAPPSLASCTRDVFNADYELSIDQILKIASMIASIAEHLHSKGIMHGDLYAHNTLIDNDGNTLFGDFGAASFYNIQNQEMASSLEGIEVMAYGYFLDDLISLCRKDEVLEIVTEIKSLRDHCLSLNVVSRPSFKSLNLSMHKLQNKLIP